MGLRRKTILLLLFSSIMSVGWGQDCDEGYVWFDEIPTYWGEPISNTNCFYQSDLDVLQQFIDNSQEGNNPPPSDLSPIELGYQKWENSRLTLFCSTYIYESGCETDYQLSGVIPLEIGNLIHLNQIMLFGNQLTGTIPIEIQNLMNLNFLDFGYNQLNGEIPIEIWSMNNLNVLSLYSNQFTGYIPQEIGNLINLWWLDLRDNQLDGQIPYEIGNLSELYNIFLQNNLFDGYIPESICDIPLYMGLHFNFSNNYFCPPYPECLSEEDIGYQDTSNCEETSLCDEEIEVELWGECYNIEETTELYLSGSGLTGQIPSQIGNLTNLTHLNLSYNELTGEIPLEIGNLTNLSSLSLYNNQLGCYEYDFNGGCEWWNPEECCITHCDETDECNGEIPSQIGNLENLNELYLWENQLTGEIPESIGELTDLTYLYLYRNNLSGIIPNSIGNLINLTHLNLSDNQLVGTIPSEICNLTNLIYINLIFNQLSGEIPDCIGNLINLTDLQLYVNNLTGEIPSSVGDLVSLHRLWLNNNQLSGNIPSEIGNLMNLYIGGIRLEHNQLTGVIPTEICNNQNLNWSSEWSSSDFSVVDDNNLCPPYPDCLVNQEPFTDENGNGIWDEGETFEDTNENGIYEEDYVGYQEPSECPGYECQISDYNGYYDCSQNCITPVYLENLLGDGVCDETFNFDCYNYGYDCGDCNEDWDGTDPLGFCSCPLVNGDTNEDDLLNVLDIMIVVNCVLSGNCGDCSDLNYDGSVDVLDIMIMVNMVLEN